MSHNIKFPCCVTNCNKDFLTFSGFKSHIYRTHAGSVADLKKHEITTTTDLACHVPLCAEKFTNLESFSKHLRQHIRVEATVNCPYALCRSAFKKVPSFSAHISRYRPSNYDNVQSEILHTLSPDNFNASEVCQKLAILVINQLARLIYHFRIYLYFN